MRIVCQENGGRNFSLTELLIIYIMIHYVTIMNPVIFSSIRFHVQKKMADKGNIFYNAIQHAQIFPLSGSLIIVIKRNVRKRTLII